MFDLLFALLIQPTAILNTSISQSHRLSYPLCRMIRSPIHHLTPSHLFIILKRMMNGDASLRQGIRLKETRKDPFGANRVRDLSRETQHYNVTMGAP
jgi:hypothetical protein